MVIISPTFFYYVGYDIRRFKEKVHSTHTLSNYYNLNNFDKEEELWYTYILWRNKKFKKNFEELELMRLLK